MSALKYFPEDFGLSAAKGASMEVGRAPERFCSNWSEAVLSINDKDLGTPARDSANLVSVEVDGRAVTVRRGHLGNSRGRTGRRRNSQTLRHGFAGALRLLPLCLVEIEGRKGFPASCTTPVEAGMKIRTHSEQLSKLRRNVMELYMSDHPIDPFECKASGKCELHEMANAVGLVHVRYEDGGRNHQHRAIDDSNPYFSFDPSRCIVCSRCVRACDETQGTFALTIEGRGFNSQMVAGQHERYLDSECVSCGACVQACPTDALMEKSLLEKGRADRAIVTTCAYCGVGCSFKAEIRGDEIVRMVPNKDGLPNHGHSCVKGRFAWGYATHPDRVKRPMIRKRISDPWQEVSWEEALGLCRSRVQTRPTEIRARLCRWNYVLAMHQRGSVPRPEAGARRFRQQQCRYLRARLSFAHRLWPQDRVRHACWYAGF